MTRYVRQIHVAAKKAVDVSPRSFSEFADQANIVLLGDPGAGKTHLFRQMAAAEQSRYIQARTFLTMPHEMIRGQVLFIDGLDEKRAGRGDRDTVDALVVKLFSAAPPKVRISCRVADWLGDSDLAAMAPFFEQTGGVCLLHLENLSHAEQVAVLHEECVSISDAERFLCEADERGLGDFLGNPQNLILLWRAVETGAWPVTRKDLFELSTTLMLREVNPDRGRSGVGMFTVKELRPVAGAVCAARLISDVEAISLTEQEGPADLPGYRSLDLFPPEKVQAALSRRIFEAAAEPEAVDYSHRTTAEFLAAEYLACRVREGLPLGRVMALMGVDGRPASELRGLHAWLAVHLPEHADELIKADPYGVLCYGDAASLAPSSCAVLVRALDHLSRTNPWFRSGNWTAKPIGALARSDMVDEFQSILRNPESGFGVRSVVVDALALGTPLSAMLPDLEAALRRKTSPYAERLGALLALLRLSDAGKAAIRNTFDNHLDRSENDLRLRTETVKALYGDPYGPDEVISLVADCIGARDTISIGVLWRLDDAIPESDLPAILDGICPPATDEVASDQGSREAAAFFVRILVRTWAHPDPFEPARVIGWLNKRVAFKADLGDGHGRDLRTAIRANPERLRALAQDFFTRLSGDAHSSLAFHDFREATLYEVSPETFAEIAVHVLDSVTEGPGRRVFFYQLALSLSFEMACSAGGALFDALYLRADNDMSLRTARDAMVVFALPDHYFAFRSGRAEKDHDDRVRQCEDFDQNIDRIRSGSHLGWLAHLAFIYFGLYRDTNNSLSPRARIAAWLGNERVDAALEALRSAPFRNDIPTFEEVVALALDHKICHWWYAIVAGLNERWQAGLGLSDLGDDFLKGLLVFDITNPVSTKEGSTVRWLIHPWRKELLGHRPELVRDAYQAISQLRLSCNEQFVNGLHDLLTEGALEPYRAAVVIDLLEQFPNADPRTLNELLSVVACSPGTHQSFLQLAGPILSGTVRVDQRQQDLWLVTAYMVEPARFESGVREAAIVRPSLVFDLRDRCGFGLGGQHHQGLQLPVLEFMARLTGSLFADAPYPTGAAWGDTNPWDGSEFFRALVNTISSFPSPAATDALQRLEADPQLNSYSSHVLYALNNQRQRRRDSEYDRPDWQQTVTTLANRSPATVADLHALLVAQLRDLAGRIAHSNTDIFKQFWNLDSYTKLTQPRPEEACRDVLITLLKPFLLPMDITVEPEGHMVADKRADISVAMPGRKVLCELKRDYHAEVWTAITAQLERFYAHDPEARGFGIYVVFWFGSKRPRSMPAPPNGLPVPTTAAELEAVLHSLLADEMAKRLSVIVIDVSGEV